MRLIVAEKPSLARAIAAAWPNTTFSRQEGFLAGGEVMISWCIGHLLEQAAPDYYDARYKRWNLNDLPIIPTTWQLEPRKQARGQLTVLRRLIKQANEVIHAGDPDREGQLLVQETLEYLGWKGPTLRLLVNDMNPTAIRKAIGQLRDNREFAALYAAAQTRSRADWLYGINLSRAWTLIGRQAGHDGVLSVGRVQTPVLGLVARRDELIEHFTPVPYYVLSVTFTTANGPCTAHWQPHDMERLLASRQADEQGRILDRQLIDIITPRLKEGCPGRVANAESKARRQPAPLPYSLSTLQIDAARRYGLRAQHTLDCCQALYERHKLVTYPRSDCRYLPLTFLHNATHTLAQAVIGDTQLIEWHQGGDMNRRSRAFNDSKIGAHHALAPTGRSPSGLSLTKTEQQVYQLIVRNVLAQFYPDLEFDELSVLFEAPLDHAPAEHFLARGRYIRQPGWKPLFSSKAESPELPNVSAGDAVQIAQWQVDDRMTRPPEPFTDASILNAMTHVARYVEDALVRQTLRDTDGLGTEATRAGIIETLVERGLLVREGKTLKASRTGRALIAALPDNATRPERTALWEQQLTAIADKQDAPAPFMKTLVDDIQLLLQQADAERMRHAFSQAPSTAPVGKAPKAKGTRRRSATPSTSKRHTAVNGKRSPRKRTSSTP